MIISVFSLNIPFLAKITLFLRTNLPMRRGRTPQTQLALAPLEVAHTCLSEQVYTAFIPNPIPMTLYGTLPLHLCPHRSYHPTSTFSQIPKHLLQSGSLTAKSYYNFVEFETIPSFVSVLDMEPSLDRANFVLH